MQLLCVNNSLISFRLCSLARILLMFLATDSFVRNQRKGMDIMKKSTLLAVTLVAASASMNVMSAPTLPDPGTLSIQYDDAYSYSVPVLDYFYPTQGWDGTAGTGTLDLILTTRAGGDGNNYQNPAPFPTATNNPNENPISGSWGTAATGTGDVLVSTVLNWLITSFNATVPQFTFDQNDTGNLSDLQVTAKVEIIDGVGGPVLHTWAMDNLFQAGDGIYDPTAWITVASHTIIPDVLNKCAKVNGDDTICSFNNNIGSGGFDYIVYVPTMDLTPWADANNLFKVSWEFNNVDNGGEEITMTGRFAPNRVPEPGILGLLALGLLGLGATTRRRQG